MQSLSSQRKLHQSLEKYDYTASLFKEFILGGQDGLVNVLGVLLGVAIGTNDIRAVIIAGLAATFAESVSMGAVAFTSTKAAIDYYNSQEEKEKYEIETIPEFEKKEIYNIYYKKGFRGKILNDIVKNITSDKKRWLDIMMKEELGLTKEKTGPIKATIVVFLAALIGSFIPLIAFFFAPIRTAIPISLVISAIALFITGAIEGKMTIGHWLKKGIQLMLIGMIAALVGFLVGKLAGFTG
jgi:VIT1/CCC1 family predicted Fe2+/Mn2+ transporter